MTELLAKGSEIHCDLSIIPCDIYILVRVLFFFCFLHFRSLSFYFRSSGTRFPDSTKKNLENQRSVYFIITLALMTLFYENRRMQYKCLVISKAVYAITPTPLRGLSSQKVIRVICAVE